MSNLISTFGEITSDLGYMGSEGDAILVFMIAYIIICLIIALIATIFQIIARWIFFNKCGESGWKAIIPVYNEITLLKLSGMNWWWIFLLYAASIYSLILSPIQIISIATESVAMSTLTSVLSLISLVASGATIITKINECINLAKKFNKNAGYGVLLFFFEPIMFLVLGTLKSNEYDAKVKVSPNGFFGGM